MINFPFFVGIVRKWSSIYVRLNISNASQSQKNYNFYPRSYQYSLIEMFIVENKVLFLLRGAKIQFSGGEH